MIAILRRLAAIAALAAGCQIAAQEPREVIFEGETFDVTGAGVLDLGILDDALMPHRSAFRQGRERLGVDLTIGADGVVEGCRFDAISSLQAAGRALCQQALRLGRFRQYPGLVLDYTRAIYRLSIRSRKDKPTKGEATFRASIGYPLERQQVLFGTYPIPPQNERLNLADLDHRSMSYPRDALENAIEARVVVAISFDEQGAVASCRPVRSSNTARIAYDTCIAAQRAFALRNPPDARPYVWVAQWMLADNP